MSSIKLSEFDNLDEVTESIATFERIKDHISKTKNRYLRPVGKKAATLDDVFGRIKDDGFVKPAAAPVNKKHKPTHQHSAPAPVTKKHKSSHEQSAPATVTKKRKSPHGESPATAIVVQAKSKEELRAERKHRRDVKKKAKRRARKLAEREEEAEASAQQLETSNIDDQTQADSALESDSDVLVESHVRKTYDLMGSDSDSDSDVTDERPAGVEQSVAPRHEVLDEEYEEWNGFKVSSDDDAPNTTSSNYAERDSAIDANSDFAEPDRARDTKDGDKDTHAHISAVAVEPVEQVDTSSVQSPISAPPELHTTSRSAADSYTSWHDDGTGLVFSPGSSRPRPSIPPRARAATFQSKISKVTSTSLSASLSDAVVKQAQPEEEDEEGAIIASLYADLDLARSYLEEVTGDFPSLVNQRLRCVTSVKTGAQEIRVKSTTSLRG
ncbi:hypothetical protein MBLNU457_4703t2 [Dothideomycetes sp. NU457]